MRSTLTAGAPFHNQRTTGRNSLHITDCGGDCILRSRMILALDKGHRREYDLID